MATFTNLSKNPISPTGAHKAKKALWGDTLATWGDAIFSWGFESESYVNLSKSTGTGGLWVSSVLPWQLSSPWTTTSGVIAWTNQDKN